MTRNEMQGKKHKILEAVCRRRTKANTKKSKIGGRRSWRSTNEIKKQEPAKSRYLPSSRGRDASRSLGDAAAKCTGEQGSSRGSKE
ncbi:unnamed protein product [Linum trigynum]|uniref:Uncharacterized protein n=1 Tax=Linum trigynum TaxID=586398 RepID=A0AAV2CN23_9ROSI